MKKSFWSLPAALILVLALALPAFAYEAFKGPLGVLYKGKGVTDGYVLITPYESKKTFLIDNDGNVVKEWVSEHIGFYAELLPNGNMVRAGRVAGGRPSNFGGTCGIIEEFDWDGKKVWEYTMMTPDKEISHHTFEVMPNGNYVLLGWEYKSYDDAVAKGFDVKDPNRLLKPEGFTAADGYVVKGIWPDFVREISRKDKSVVWEWHVWDHLGKGADKIDPNKYIHPRISKAYAGPDWTHFNGIAYNPRADQFCITSRNLAEVYIVNKKDGKIVYRWGNPANYGAGREPAGFGDNGDQTLWGPHAPDWTPDDTITILDNGHNRPSGNYTRGIELDPKKSEVIWEWGPSSVNATGGSFYSAYQSGAQKLPNGNWMITTTNYGHVVEVTNEKEIVWEFISPVRMDKIYKTSHKHGGGGDNVHKAMRYAKDWPGFKGKSFKTLYKMPNWTKVLDDDPAPARPGFDPKKPL